MDNERSDGLKAARAAIFDALKERGMLLDAATGTGASLGGAHLRASRHNATPQEAREGPSPSNGGVTCNACVTLAGRVAALEEQVSALQGVTSVTLGVTGTGVTDGVTVRSKGAARVAAYRARRKG